MKFLGACNGQKTAMDHCFREEKDVKRKANLAKSKEGNKEWYAKRDDAWYSERDIAWKAHMAARKNGSAEEK